MASSSSRPPTTVPDVPTHPTAAMAARAAVSTYEGGSEGTDDGFMGVELRSLPIAGDGGSVPLSIAAGGAVAGGGGARSASTVLRRAEVPLAGDGAGGAEASGASSERTPLERGVLPPKASTTSTLFLNATLHSPDNDELCLGVASVLHCQMSLDEAGGAACPPAIAASAAVFNEETYTRRPSLAGGVESVEEIYRFIKTSFDIAQFSPECNIISLVLVNRLVGKLHIPLTRSNWRLLMLTSLLVAQKVWDDRALANIDFPTVWSHATDTVLHGALNVRIVNSMERKFLELLAYNVTVSGSLYAKYFFELRDLVQGNKLPWRVEPLSAEAARKLEATSKRKREEFKLDRGLGAAVGEVARAHTVADLPSASASATPGSSRSRAVLS